MAKRARMNFYRNMIRNKPPFLFEKLLFPKGA